MGNYSRRNTELFVEEARLSLDLAGNLVINAKISVNTHDTEFRDGRSQVVAVPIAILPVKYNVAHQIPQIFSGRTQFADLDFLCYLHDILMSLECMVEQDGSNLTWQIPEGYWADCRITSKGVLVRHKSATIADAQSGTIRGV